MNSADERLRSLSDQLEAARSAERVLTTRLNDAEQALGELTRSAAWRLVCGLRNARRRLAPDGSTRHRFVRLAVSTARSLKRRGVRATVSHSWDRMRRGHLLTPPEVKVRTHCPTRAREPWYQGWINRHEPKPEALRRQRIEARRLPVRPWISVLVPVFDTPGSLLDAAIRSVVAQTYDHWELCLADGGSTCASTIETLRRWEQRDPRIRVHRLDVNLGISGNTNAALEIARGAFVALLDHDDMLAPWALWSFAERLSTQSELDFLYSDRDQIDAAGEVRFEPFFKPKWSPDLMLSGNYATHLCLIRTEIARAIGGFRPRSDGAQDWDFFLRVAERTSPERIAHVPAVLYHWRVWERSVASGIQAKPYALEAMRYVLVDALRREGTLGTLEFVETGIHLRIEPTGRTRVAIVIDGSESDRVAEGLRERTRYPHWDSLVVRAADPRRSWPALAWAASGLEADTILWLAGHLNIEDERWLDELVGWIERPGIGVVGGTVVGPNRQRADIGATRIDESGRLVPLGADLDDALRTSLYKCLGWYRNVLALPGDMLMVRRDALNAIGGPQTTDSPEDLCARIGASGRRIVVNPYARLIDPTGRPRARSARLTHGHDPYEGTWASPRAWLDPQRGPDAG